VDILTFAGTFGLFLTLFLLFIRFLPMICMFEVKAVLPESDPHYQEGGDREALPELPSGAENY